MPIYSFQCLLCGTEFDEIYKINNCPQERKCSDPKCSGTAIKVISSRGTVFSDTPTWLDGHIQGALLDVDSRHFRPIESRTELKRHIKKNGICEAPRSGPRWI
jgi:putative FmdB family regulatory protein